MSEARRDEPSQRKALRASENSFSRIGSSTRGPTGHNMPIRQSAGIVECFDLVEVIGRE